MKIKTERFMVWNHAASCSWEKVKEKHWEDYISQIWTAEQIDDWIEEWLEDNYAELIDLIITPIESNYHNNGYDNTIYLQYTLKYEQKDKNVDTKAIDELIKEVWGE